MWTVYVLWSASREVHYKGCTNDLHRRLREHNAGKVPSTKSGNPWVVQYIESFDSKSEALKRERFFKTRSGYRWLKQMSVIEQQG